jgi:hypothetical protein
MRSLKLNRTSNRVLGTNQDRGVAGVRGLRKAICASALSTGHACHAQARYALYQVLKPVLAGVFGSIQAAIFMSPCLESSEMPRGWQATSVARLRSPRKG